MLRILFNEASLEVIHAVVGDLGDLSVQRALGEAMLVQVVGAQHDSGREAGERVDGLGVDVGARGERGRQLRLDHRARVQEHTDGVLAEGAQEGGVLHFSSGCCHVAWREKEPFILCLFRGL